MNRILRIGSIAVSAAAMTVGLTAPAAASTSTRVTHGDAVAVFQAQSTGGFAAEQAEQHGNHPGQGQPAPLADERAPVVISPISSGPDDPYCALDWHVIRVLLSRGRTGSAPLLGRHAMRTYRFLLLVPTCRYSGRSS